MVLEPKSRRRRRVRNGRNRNRAPVSTPVSISPKNAASVTLFGTDRLFHVPDISGYAAGDVAIDFSVNTASFKRMRHMAEAYQRVHFEKLVFRVVSMCPTSVTGGFAAAFVSDPTDVLGGGNDSLDRVVAQNGSKVTKAWEDCRIVARLGPDLLYTSDPPLGDQRLSSPGRFWLVMESKVNQKVPLTIYCDWKVTFSVASLEGTEKSGGVLVVQAPFYTRASNVGLWWKDGPGGDDPRPKIPGITFDTVYQSKQKFYLSFSKAGNFDKFKLVNDKNHGVTLAPVAPDGSVVVETTEQNQWVFEKGDVLTPLPENVQVGSEFHCQRSPCDISLGTRQGSTDPPSNSSQQSSEKSSMTRQSQLSKLLNSLTVGSSQQGPTKLSLLESLMESPLSSSGLQRSPSFEVLDEEL